MGHRGDVVYLISHFLWSAVILSFSSFDGLTPSGLTFEHIQSSVFIVLEFTPLFVC